MIEINGAIFDVSIEDIIKELRFQCRGSGIDLLKDTLIAGDNIMVTCPKHSNGRESKPSCGITLKKMGTYPAGTVHCFTCGFKSDLLTFISKVLGYNDGGAKGWKWLVSYFIYTNYNKRNVNVTLPSRTKKEIEKEVIPESELDKYRYTVDYMYSRGLTDDLIEKFDIGYDNENIALTFPIKDDVGDVIAIQKRLIHRKQFINMQGLKKHYLYGYYEYLKMKNRPGEIWLTESILDCLTAWKHGHPAVASLGEPSNFQIRLLQSSPARKIVFAFDNDEAGDNFNKKLEVRLKNKLLYKIEYPLGKKDLNECDLIFDQIKEKLYIP